MGEIAMRHVQLDLVETNAKRALGRRDEGRSHTFHVGFGHFARRVPTFAERNWRGRNRRPGVSAGLERGGAFPRTLCRALAAGMSNLDTKSRAEIGRAH